MTPISTPYLSDPTNSTPKPPLTFTATSSATQLSSFKRTSNPPGTGSLHLANPLRSYFSTLLASYPLKLLAPSPLPSQPRNLSTVYTLAYGGGLVAGDLVSLKVQIDKGCGLVMLTQGSTKVFKRRIGLRPLSHSIVRESIYDDSQGHIGSNLPPTKQRLQVKLEPNSFLLLLPDSISPFRSSQYVQAQRFVLPEDESASLLILDWVNSGRGQRPPSNGLVVGNPPLKTKRGDDVVGNGEGKEDGGIKGESGRSLQEVEIGDAEIWAMDSYTSTNEVIISNRTIMRERMVLSNLSTHSPTSSNLTSTISTSKPPPNTSTYTPVAIRLAPYHLYATVLIYGPHLKPLLTYLSQIVDNTSQYQLPNPPGLLWSFSPVEKGLGGVLRVASAHVEDARSWLREVFKNGGVENIVGPGLWPRCI